MVVAYFFGATLYITHYVKFKRSLINVKNVSIDQVMLYRFGKVWRIASEEVVLHLVTTKFIPSFYMARSLSTYQGRTALTRLRCYSFYFLMKLFNTSSINVIKDCCRCFSFKLQRELIEKRFKNSCQNVVSDHVRGYFVTHCAFIALL